GLYGMGLVRYGYVISEISSFSLTRFRSEAAMVSLIFHARKMRTSFLWKAIRCHCISQKKCSTTVPSTRSFGQLRLKQANGSMTLKRYIRILLQAEVLLKKILGNG